MSIEADIMFNGIMHGMFRPTSEVETKEIIIKSPNKSRDLDSFPHLAFAEMCGSTSTTDDSHY